jgi:alpha-tubulin suppressor-like RCC1 family protein
MTHPRIAAALVLLALTTRCGDSVNPALPSALVLFSGTGQNDSLGATLTNPFVVRVLDAGANGLPGIPVVWSVTAGGGNLSVTESTTDQNGRASVILTLGTVPGANTVSASVAHLTSVSFSATAYGPAAQLAFTGQPSNSIAGSAIGPSLEVTIQDAQGNRVSRATHAVTVAITSGTGGTGATLGGTATQGAVNGVATFSNLSIAKAATGYTLTATASGLTADTSTTFNVGPAPSVHLTFTTPPSDVTAGAVITPAVQLTIYDGYGNLATTASDTVTIALGTCCAPSGTLRGTLQRTPALGVVTFNDLTIDKADSDYTLEVTAPRLGHNSSSFFTVHAGPPARVGFITQPIDRVTNARFDPYLWVAVEDAQRNPLANQSATVTIAITPGTGAAGATLSGTLTRSTDSGVVIFDNLSIDTPGSGYRLTPAAPGLASDTSVSFRILGPFVAATVSASLYLSNCALTSSGAAYCWGYNGRGGLGDGSTIDRNAPVPVSGGRTFARVSAGGSHSCGLAASTAYCWGLNSSGELGDSTYIDKTTPVRVSGGYSFASISAGPNHTCAVTSSGVGYCWGNNGGNLGNGTTPPTNTPIPIAGAHTFAMVSAGNQHSCGVRTDSAAYCWGSNAEGELGNGAGGVSTTPVPVSGGLSFSFVSAGAFHSCGLASGGAAYCWGANNHGQLGDGSSNVRSRTPVPVAGGLSFAALSVGYNQNCGLTATGAAYCWGDNSSGQIGDSTLTERRTPVLVPGLTFTTISTGFAHTCAIATGDIAYCWGDSRALGNRGPFNSWVPVQVSEP